MRGVALIFLKPIDWLELEEMQTRTVSTVIN